MIDVSAYSLLCNCIEGQFQDHLYVLYNFTILQFFNTVNIMKCMKLSIKEIHLLDR